MTAQISDRLALEGRVYAVAAVDGGGLFKPADVGVRPASTCTACWRGYVCRYAIQEEELILERLWLSLGGSVDGEFEARRGPSINGVEPKTPQDRGTVFNNVYEGLGLPIRFTGKMLIGDEFIQALYVHMGFHPAWKYRVVLELTFEEGHLLQVEDVSEEMALIRQRRDESPPTNREP